MTRTATVVAGLLFGFLGAEPAFGQAKVVPAAGLPDPAGSPDIASIAHLGVRTVSGTIPAGTREGAASPGELLLVAGKNFGKAPEVTIAGQKAEVVARTADGGIVARVPSGTPVGERAVTVKTNRGDPALSGMRFRRYAMASIPKDKIVHVVELGEGASRRSMTVPAESPEDLRFSSDGTAGYILDGKKGGAWNVIAVDMTPIDKPVSKGVVIKRTTDVSALLTARHAPIMVIVDTATADVFDLTNPLAPKKVASTPLPKEMAGMTVQSGEIAPDGKAFALLGDAKNRVVVGRIDDKGGVTAAGPALDVLAGYTGEHASRALRFSPDGASLWVISGGNPEIAKKGAKEFTRLSAVNIPASGPASMGKVRVLKGARAPRDFVVTWGRSSGGNFEPIPPDDVAMVLAAAPDKLFEINPKDLNDPKGRKAVLKSIGKEANPGLLYRMNNKGGEPVGLKMSSILLDVEVTPDTSSVVCFALTPKVGEEDVEFEVGVASAPALSKSPDGILETGFIGLTKIKPEELKPPFRYGEVRVQP